MSWVIGVDVGGTNLRVAAFADLGPGRAHAPVAVARQPVGADPTVDRVVDAIGALIDRVTAEAGADRDAPIGVGLAAMLGDRRGRVVNAPNLHWRDVDFGARLSARCRRPLGVYNDVNAIAYGEYGVGAGQGARDLLAVFVGTGVGAGVIADGRLVEGATNCAGELGHVKVAWGPAARPCPCGQRGCVEAYAGGASKPGATPERLAEAAQLLAVAIGNAIAVLNCDRLVLGGGVLAHLPALRRDLVDALPAIVPLALWRPLTIADASLGDDAGIVGAALLAAAGVSLF